MPAVCGANRIRATKLPRLTASEALSRSPIVAEGRCVVEQMPTPGVRCDGGGNVDGGLEELERCLNLLHRGYVQDESREVLQILRQLGGDGQRYLKERKRAIRQIVSEIYSPPRVTAAAKLLPELRCVPGFALDLTVDNDRGEPWDFDIAENRRKARAMVVEQKPMTAVKRLV